MSSEPQGTSGPSDAHEPKEGKLGERVVWLCRKLGGSIVWLCKKLGRSIVWLYKKVGGPIVGLWKLTRAWRVLWLQFFERALSPLIQPKSVLYLLVAIVGLGSAGVWVTWALHRNGHASPHEIALHVGTFAFAIAVSSVVDVLIDKDLSLTLRFLLVAIDFSVLVGCVIYGYQHIYAVGEAEQVSFSSLVLVLLPVWLAWWLANAADPRFKNEVDAMKAMGGNPEEPL